MNEHAAKEAEFRIAEWLSAAQTTFVQHCRLPKDKASTIDFLVISPIPFAIELTIISSRSAAQRRHNRFLAQRLQLAEAYGIDLPLISICGPGTPRGYEAVNPYADVTLRLDDGLPPPSECGIAAINSDVRHIFTSGRPFPLALTPKPAIEDMLRRALTLTELRAGVVESRHEDVAFIAAGLQPRPNDEHRLPSPLLVPSPAEIKALMDRALELIALRTRTETMAASIPVPHGRLTVAGVRKADGRVSIVRPFFVAATEVHSAHRFSELLADAWLLRAQSAFRIDHLCLLMIPFEAKTSTTIKGIKRTVTPEMVSLCMDCETIGWRPFTLDGGDGVARLCAAVEATAIGTPSGDT